MATANYGVITHAQQTHPQSPADVAAHVASSHVRAPRTPAPLPVQTRAALLAELLAAVAEGKWGKVLEIELAAVEEDQRHPGEPRLMDEVRAILDAAKAVAA